MKRFSNLFVLGFILFTLGCAQVGGKSAAKNTIYTPENQVEQSWSVTSLPDDNDCFYYHQRTFDQDGSTKGFISYRHLTDAPKYEELGRVLVVGEWRLDGNKLITQTLGHLPPHKELSTVPRVWTIKELTMDTMVLESDGKKVSLVKAVIGPDQNKTGSDIVQFYSGRVLDLGF